MDNDVSHAVQEQLDALSARIDALENPNKETDQQPVEDQETVEQY